MLKTHINAKKKKQKKNIVNQTSFWLTNFTKTNIDGQIKSRIDISATEKPILCF